MRKNIYAIIDVETAGNFEVPKVYDIGVVICDKQGNELYKKMWLILEVLKDTKKMRTAYYAEKLPMYIKMIDENPDLLVPFKQMKAELNAILKKFDVNIITAYNLKFDIGALKYTNYRFDYPKHGWTKCKFFDKKYKYIDLWSMACETLGQQKRFKKFVDDNKLLTEKGNRKSSAEVMYGYITNNAKFVEQHTGLADCLIEKEIMLKCFDLKQKFTQDDYVPNPWRLVQG